MNLFPSNKVLMYKLVTLGTGMKWLCVIQRETK